MTCLFLHRLMMVSPISSSFVFLSKDSCFTFCMVPATSCVTPHMMASSCMLWLSTPWNVSRKYTGFEDRFKDAAICVDADSISPSHPARNVRGVYDKNAGSFSFTFCNLHFIMDSEPLLGTCETMTSCDQTASKTLPATRNLSQHMTI